MDNNRYYGEMNENMALVDYLTKLSNRRGLYDYYASLKPDQRVHMMFLDIDRFKKVNDTYGHGVGDELLIAVAEKIRQKVGDAFASRVGGDEFVILVDGAFSKKKVVEMAQALLKSISELEVSVDVKAIISFSIGLLIDQSVTQDIGEALVKCDAAMYQAKKEGKNRYIIYDSIEKELLYRKSIEREMRDALQNGEFQVYLQPQLNIINSKVIGAEALVRWVHPKDGVRLPKMFLQTLEDNGFILSMDMYVFEQVCIIRKKWTGTPLKNTTTSVNMSKLHLYEPDFVSQLAEIAAKHEVAPSELIIEISSDESHDNKEMKATFIELKKAGFGTAIDKFGSGYFALSILSSEQVDMIKLDEELLSESEQNNNRKAIVKNLITMTKELGIDMVVEGVTHKEQEQFLTSCGANLAQGFYYCKPVPLDKFETFFNTHMQKKDDVIRYHFLNDVADEKERYVGTISGEVTYTEGIVEGTGAIRLAGGPVMMNVLQLPVEVLQTEGFTVAMWLKAEKLSNWTSVFFAQAENGFTSFMPYAWQKISMFRVKDGSQEEGGWYDVLGSEFFGNEWIFICMTYNAKTALTRLYKDGALDGYRNNVCRLNRYVQVTLGGDYYQESFCGEISELMICNYAMTESEVKELYDSYLSNPTCKKKI